MDANFIQNSIYKRFCTIDKTMIAMVPNCYTLLENECDVFGVRKSLLTDEFEIKISRQDFLADSKKKVRFKLDTGGYSEWMLKSEAYTTGVMPTNYFWCVCPKGLLEVSDIPNYAGFAVVLPSGIVQIVKSAPKLSKVKMDEKDIIKHISKLSSKFWFIKDALKY